MQKMSKEEFIEILSRQQRSGLTIKDFCINEAYTESSFYYWKVKFGLSMRYHMDRHSSSLEEFAPLASPLHLLPPLPVIVALYKRVRSG